MIAKADSDLLLPSGQRPISKPLSMLRAFFNKEYINYDAVVVAGDSMLRPEEIALSVMVNSQISGNTARAIWDNRGEVQRNLERIDPNLSLVAGESEIPWSSIHGAIAGICKVPRAKIAVSTKILHKKRPELIPILDSVIVGYYKPRLGRARFKDDAARAIAVLKEFRRDLVSAEERLRACHRLLGHDDITLCRMLEVLLWVTNEPRGYYRGVK